MTTIDRFSDIAAGATSLEVKLEKGDLNLRAGEGQSWSFSYSSNQAEPPRITREGDRLVIEQQSEFFHNRRMDVELTVPTDVTQYELRTGHGRCRVEGTSGRLELKSGHGGVELRRGSGEAEVNTGHGGLEVEGWQGPMQLHTGHGGVRVQDVQGDVELRTGHGRIEIERCVGHVRTNTGHGDVRIADSGGEVELRSGHGGVEVADPRDLVVAVKNGNGGVRIDGGTLRGLHLRTGRGNVESTAQLQPGSYDVNTGMGNIALGLPDGVSIRVDLQTGFGEIHTDLPLVQVGRSGPMGFGGSRMVGSLGEGDAKVELELRTGKGNIALQRAGSTAPPRWSRPNPWWRTIEDPATLTQGAADAIESAARNAMRAAGPVAARAAEEALRQAEEAMQQAAREVERNIEGAFGRRPPPAPPIPPTPPQAPLPPQDDPTLAVLERLAKGEITLEEAQAQLNKR